MDTTLETLDGDRVKLTVAVDEPEFDAAVDAAFKRIAKEVRLPGFRPGKAPRKLLEARIGVAAGRQEALQQALPDYYGRALTENEVDAIDQPEIEITILSSSAAPPKASSPKPTEDPPDASHEPSQAVLQ